LATRYLRLLVRPPLRRDPPMTGVDVAATSVAWLGCVVLLGLFVALGRGPMYTSSTLLLAGLCVFSYRINVHVTETVTVGFAEVFEIVLLFVAGPRQAAAAILLIGLLRLLTFSPSTGRSLQEVVGTSAFTHTGTLSMLAAVYGLESMGVSHTALGGMLILGFAAYVVSNLISLLLLGAIMWLDAGSSAAERRDVVRRVAQFGQTMAVPMLILVPLAVLGGVAARVDVAAVTMLVVPVVAAWFVARQAKQLAQAQIAAGTDALTGLCNRGRFFDRASAELEYAHRYRRGLAVIMGDLDNFKRVNDTLGHTVGDGVLRDAARALAGEIEDAVFPLARYGGEEFVIAVPALDRAGVLELAERARAAVELALEPWGTSITLGVAYATPADQLETLVDRADKALYSAKYAGKNRVHEWRGGSIGDPSAEHDDLAA
jgi:diguanylate cyclase (GGDEF)-like protein